MYKYYVVIIISFPKTGSTRQSAMTSSRAEEMKNVWKKNKTKTACLLTLFPNWAVNTFLLQGKTLCFHISVQ